MTATSVNDAWQTQNVSKLGTQNRSEWRKFMKACSSLVESGHSYDDNEDFWNVLTSAVGMLYEFIKLLAIVIERAN